MVNKISPTTNPIEYSQTAAGKTMKVNVFAYWEGDGDGKYIGSNCTMTGEHSFWYAGKGHAYECTLFDGITAWFSGQCFSPIEA
jgi:hypothetical protein